MTKHAKARRTEQRGLRPSTRPESFSLKEIQKMGERINKILADRQEMSKEEEFLLKQVHSVCLFRKAGSDLRNELLLKINKREEMGHQLGFSQEDLRSLNRWVISRDLIGNLGKLLQEVEERLAGAKK